MSAHHNDLDPKQLLALSNEVGRLATTLARLSTDHEIAQSAEEATPAGPPISSRAVSDIFRARRLRSHFFDDQLFADPAWDMLLDLFHADLTYRRVSVSSLCIAAAVPATTAIRWVKALTERGLLVRRSDPFDGRRVYVELTPEAASAMRQYFAKQGAERVI